MGLYNLGEIRHRQAIKEETIDIINNDYIKMVAENAYNATVLEAYTEYTILNEGLLDAIGSIFESIIEFIKSIFSKLGEAIGGLFGGGKKGDGTKSQEDKLKIILKNGGGIDVTLHTYDIEEGYGLMNKLEEFLKAKNTLVDKLSEKLPLSELGNVSNYKSADSEAFNKLKVLGDIEVEFEDPSDKSFLADMKKKVDAMEEKSVNFVDIQNHLRLAVNGAGDVDYVAKARANAEKDKNNAIAYVKKIKTALEKVYRTSLTSGKAAKKLKSVISDCKRAITLITQKYSKAAYRRIASAAALKRSVHKKIDAAIDKLFTLVQKKGTDKEKAAIRDASNDRLKADFDKAAEKNKESEEKDKDNKDKEEGDKND